MNANANTNANPNQMSIPTTVVVMYLLQQITYQGVDSNSHTHQNIQMLN
jgi:predicted component of type VI protein secretion system